MSTYKSWPHWLSWLPFGKVPQVSTLQLASDLKKFQLIDVRTTQEFNRSHIPGALSIPLHKLNATSISQIPPEKPVICICLSAHRSKPATRKFINAGFNAQELEGGMLAWWQQKLPTE